MKKINKIFLGTVLLAVALSGCKFKEDAGKTITGNEANKEVDTENKSGKLERHYVSTGVSHFGGKFTITMEKSSAGVMGIIFDLVESDKTTEAKDFFIVGISDISPLLRAYVSKYTNVTKIEEDNFGTSLEPNPATEDVVLELGAPESTTVDKTKGMFAKSTFTDGDNYVFCFDIYPTDTDGNKLYTKSNLNQLYVEDPKNPGKAGKEYTGDAYGFKVDIYTKDFASKELSVPIPSTKTGYTKENPMKQNKIAYYYNIQKDSTMKGSWKADFYAAAEVIE